MTGAFPTQLISLYSTPPVKNSASKDAVKKRETVLDKLERVIEDQTSDSGVVSGAEARLWLTADLSGLSVSEEVKIARFHEVLSKKMDIGDSNNSKFIDQILLLCCQVLPRVVANIFKHKGSILRRFFEEDRSRIRQWFNHFKFNGNHEFGAVGLEKYLFDNREQFWSKLRWIGRRDVPPCVAVHKRNLFLELDVLYVVEMLADEDEKFWYSAQFQDDLESGDFMAIDYMYFVHELKDLLRDERDAPEVLELLVEYIKKQPHKELCQQLLRFFSDSELLSFIYHIMPFNKHMSLTQYVLSECRWDDVSQLVVYNAIANHANTIITHFLKDDEAESARDDLTSWLQRHLPLQTQEDKVADQTAHWAYRYYIQEKTNSGATALLKAKFVLLEGFLLLFRLRAGGELTRTSLEALFKNEDVQFTPIIIQEEPLFDEDRHNRQKKKRKHKHKRRRSESPSPPPPSFVGWQFPTSKQDNTPSVTYGVKETPEYLYTSFVERTLRWLLGSVKK